jgi:hypothetical protein
MLMHVSPEELHGLQALAVHKGTSLTINPETGLPEAFSLKSLLPALAGFALGPAGFGLMSSALGAGAVVGGITALTSRDLGKGLMAGLGAYGGSSLAEGLMGMGGAGAGLSSLGGVEPSIAGGATAAQQAAMTSAAAPTGFGAAQAGAQAAFNNPSSIMPAFGGGEKLLKTAAMAAAPVLADQMVPTATKMPNMADYNPGYIRTYHRDPVTGLPVANTPVKANEWGARDINSTTPFAAGGLTAFAEGGKTDDSVPLSLERNTPPAANTMTGESLAAYNFLMGKGDYPGRTDALSKVVRPPAPGPDVGPLPKSDGGGGGGGGGGGSGGGTGIIGGMGGPAINTGYAQGNFGDAVNYDPNDPSLRAGNADSGLDSLISGAKGLFDTAKNTYLGAGDYAANKAKDIGTTALGGIMALTGLGMGDRRAADDLAPVETAVRKPADETAYEALMQQLSKPATVTVNPGDTPKESDPLDALRALNNNYNNDSVGYDGMGGQLYGAEDPMRGLDQGNEYTTAPEVGDNLSNYDFGSGASMQADYGSPKPMSNRDDTLPSLMSYAQGGLSGLPSNLGGYSDGGRLLRGPGDGVSDSIPATIGEDQPARLADGEFVFPARIVSELGNGSTEAGARALYKMMDRIQAARGRTTGKNQVAVNSNATKYLPA